MFSFANFDLFMDFFRKKYFVFIIVEIKKYVEEMLLLVFITCKSYEEVEGKKMKCKGHNKSK